MLKFSDSGTEKAALDRIFESGFIGIPEAEWPEPRAFIDPVIASVYQIGRSIFRAGSEANVVAIIGEIAHRGLTDWLRRQKQDTPSGSGIALRSHANWWM